MTTAKTVKTLVLKLALVDNLTKASSQKLRDLLCDGWMYGFKDGSKISDGEFKKMLFCVEETERQLRFR